jgi:hypothetical protein
MVLIYLFFAVCILFSLWMLIKPNFFVKTTIYWNKWFLNLIGYEAEIKVKPNAPQIVRVIAGLMLFVFVLTLMSMIDLIFMSFR